jgi:hypothetical protein
MCMIRVRSSGGARAGWVKESPLDAAKKRRVSHGERERCVGWRERENMRGKCPDQTANPRRASFLSRRRRRPDTPGVALLRLRRATGWQRRTSQISYCLVISRAPSLALDHVGRSRNRRICILPVVSLETRRPCPPFPGARPHNSHCPRLRRERITCNQVHSENPHAKRDGSTNRSWLKRTTASARPSTFDAPTCAVASSSKRRCCGLDTMTASANRAWARPEVS